MQSSLETVGSLRNDAPPYDCEAMCAFPIIIIIFSCKTTYAFDQWDTQDKKSREDTNDFDGQ